MNTEKEQKEIEEKWQTERLEKQINFIRMASGINDLAFIRIRE